MSALGPTLRSAQRNLQSVMVRAAHPTDLCGTGFQPVKTRVANPCHTFFNERLDADGVHPDLQELLAVAPFDRGVLAAAELLYD